MAYETKAILIAISEIIKKSKSREDIYDAVMRMANAEGIVLEPFSNENESKES